MFEFDFRQGQQLAKAHLAPPEPVAPKYITGSAEGDRAVRAGGAAETVWGEVVVTKEKNDKTFTVKFTDPITGKMKSVDVIPDFMPTAEKNAAGQFRSAESAAEVVIIADSKYKWTEGKNLAQDDQIRAMLVMAARAKKPFVFLVREGGNISKGIIDFAKRVGAEIHVISDLGVR